MPTAGSTVNTISAGRAAPPTTSSRSPTTNTPLVNADNGNGNGDDLKEFGMLGTNGVAAGLFLTSPYSADPSRPDIQVTLYSSVR